MTLPDQLSEASKQQLATQIDFFHTLTARAFDHAERILALNLQTTRAALDQTSGTVRQLAAARDPRDLFALGKHSQQQMDAVLAYGRKLVDITSKPAPAATAAAPPAPAAQQHIVSAPPVLVSEPVPEPLQEPVVEAAPEAVPVVVQAVAPEPDAADILPSKHPLGEADPAPTPAIAASPKPIAGAARKVAAAPVAAAHPAAMPIPEPDAVTIPAITPADASAEPTPPDASAAPQTKRAKNGKKR